MIQDIQSLGKIVIWITTYPLDKDGLNNGIPYERPGCFPEGAGELGQGKIDCTPDMTISDCRRYWNSNYEYFIDQLELWCEGNNVAFINAFQLIRDTYGDENTDDFVEAYSKDGVHIGYPGTEIIYNHIRAELETILLSDTDNDEVIDCTNDNCLSIYNPDQVDTDEDGKGDVCDNCPNEKNQDQQDIDLDGMGDVCDPDDDNDELLDQNDNCPNTPNPDQMNSDTDSHGDACDNCPNNYNPAQTDCDEDGTGDTCDEDTIDNDSDGVDDGEGVGHGCDNCPDHFNPDQLDSYPQGGNSDPSAGFYCGDVCECDGDFECDGDVDGTDAVKFKADFFRKDCPSCGGWPCVYE